jgi:small-conductance mechanosensitive channel
MERSIDVERIASALVSATPGVVLALAILAGFWIGFRVMRIPLRALLARSGHHETLIELLVDRLLRFTVLAFGLVMAADQLGVNVRARPWRASVSSAWPWASRPRTRSPTVPIGIAYKESIPAARETLLQAVAGLEHILEEPAPDVVAMGCGASSVDLEVRVWVDEAELERPVFHSVMEASKLALDAAGIQIPYPHLQLFVDDVEERVWSRAAALVRPPLPGAEGAAGH